MLPKVSVAIPSYNQKDFLRECLESVLAQDYQNLEIVVSDDGSTDGTQEMLKEYDKKYPGLFKLVLNEKNQGITANNNTAYFNCTGKYIAWVDGDDLMFPGKIRKQVELMESHPNCVFCFHNLEVFDSDSGKVIKYYLDPKRKFPPQGRNVENIVKFGGFVGRASQFFRRSACPPQGFDNRMTRSADWLFMIETASKGETKYIPEVLGRFRWHQNNVTKKIGSDLSTKFLTLGIVEWKLPHLAKYARLCRSRYLYSIAVEKILNHREKEGRSILLESLRQGWVSWKWIFWYLNSWLKFGFPK